MHVVVIDYDLDKVCCFKKKNPQSWHASTQDSSVNMHMVQDMVEMKMLIKNGHMLSGLSVC